jgi:hypothetical protein
MNPSKHIYTYIHTSKNNSTKLKIKQVRLNPLWGVPSEVAISVAVIFGYQTID